MRRPHDRHRESALAVRLHEHVLDAVLDGLDVDLAVDSGKALVKGVEATSGAVVKGTRRAVEGDGMKPEKRLFVFSILYLFALFAMLPLRSRSHL